MKKKQTVESQSKKISVNMPLDIYAEVEKLVLRIQLESAQKVTVSDFINRAVKSKLEAERASRKAHKDQTDMFD